MKDPKKLTPKQAERRARKKARYEREMAKNKKTFAQRGRYAKRLAKYGARLPMAF